MWGWWWEGKGGARTNTSLYNQIYSADNDQPAFCTTNNQQRAAAGGRVGGASTCKRGGSVPAGSADGFSSSEETFIPIINNIINSINPTTLDEMWN